SVGLIFEVLGFKCQPRNAQAFEERLGQLSDWFFFQSFDQMLKDEKSAAGIMKFSSGFAANNNRFVAVLRVSIQEILHVWKGLVEWHAVHIMHVQSAMIHQMLKCHLVAPCRMLRGL